jgi:hypothetical protein
MEPQDTPGRLTDRGDASAGKGNFASRPNLGLPFGIKVESLTNRKVEIEASVDLARDIRDLLR